MGTDTHRDDDNDDTHSWRTLVPDGIYPIGGQNENLENTVCLNMDYALRKLEPILAG